MQPKISSQQFWQRLFSTRLEGIEGKSSFLQALHRIDMRDYQKENCKYTDLSRLGNQQLYAPSQHERDLCQAHYKEVLGSLSEVISSFPRLVYMNGQFQKEFSDADVSITPFREADASETVSGTEDPFYLLNGALCEEQAYVSVKAGDVPQNLVLISVGASSGKAISFHPRLKLVLEQNAKLNLLVINAGEGDFFHNPVMDITLERGAALEHVTIQKQQGNAVCISPYRVRASEKAYYKGFVMGLDANLSRYEMRGCLEGRQAEIQFNGMQYLLGKMVGDLSGVIFHRSPQCISRQYVRNVAEHESRGVFQGKVHVDPGASKTDGSQLSQNLLLSSQAQIDTKPELEIYAEDVSCNHGATIGELDGEALFYLQARGIPFDKAREMLVKAFLEESLTHIANEHLRNQCFDGLRAHHERLGSDFYDS